MARRSDIDWEEVEKDYRAGSMSVAAISKKHNVSSSQIRLKAKQLAWARDLSAAIEARTKAKVSSIDVAALIEQSASESASKSAKLIQEAIEQASDVATGVIVRHRADIRIAGEMAKSIEDLLDKSMSEIAKSGEVSISDVSKAAQTFKLLVDAKAKLIEKEREAFSISGKQIGEEGIGGIEISFVDGN